MRQFADVLNELPEYRTAVNSLKEKNNTLLIGGLASIHKAHFAYNFLLDKNISQIIITPDEQSAAKLVFEINSLCGEDFSALYPTRDFIYTDAQSISREYEHIRLAVLNDLRVGKLKIVVSSAEAALQYTIPPEVLKENTSVIKSGESYDMDEICLKLIRAGYKHSEQVDGICQFARRGGILDLFPSHSEDPYRIEFWGDEVDSIAHFKADTQRRYDLCDSVDITPAKEVLYSDDKTFIKLLEDAAEKAKHKKACEQLSSHILELQNGMDIENADRYLPIIYKTPATLFDYCKESALIISDPVGVKEALRAISATYNEDIVELLDEGVLFKGCDTFSADYTYLLKKVETHPSIAFETFIRNSYDFEITNTLTPEAIQLSPWSGEYRVICDEVQELIAHKYCCVIAAGTERGAKALVSDFLRDDIPAVYVSDIPKIVGGQVFVIGIPLPSGFEYPALKLTVKAHGKTGSPLSKRKKTPKMGDKIKALSDLTQGDYVVHTAHGIGVFNGIVKREVHGVTKDYIKIGYAGTDTLFVPVTQLDLVSKYIGAAEDKSVRLNKLNSVEWSNTRKRVKKAVAEMAKELIELYSKRLKAVGHSFGEDDDWQREFEARFPYEETDDQLRCIDEIKGDMHRPSPMDRLLCGDVGFGKTEVAIRGAFKCVMGGKQCAVLVPTTILAWQHFKTFTQRMEGYPIKVELLSRFRTPKQQEEVIKRLKKGEVDIVIGTHRIIQKDVEFKDLGLCVIDEEQRFGVTHKERFKELRNSVDVLTLSATPIPRTLNMAMSGIRDMSLIEEAPQDRHPVQTYVVEHDMGVIEQAIRKELRRGGQIFYLHNRVETIDSCAKRLADLLPEARIVTAHGRMGEEKLSSIWQSLVEGEIDILICTTIIETGVDVPNCNTLIIEDADKMGLSQLYQLRGRVGRSSRRAFAYLTFTRGKSLTDIATKRLSAIKEFTSFGSGFRIAMRDLEIRGAGSILGAKQHGHMEAVGYDMYLKLLSEAISEEKGEVKVKTSTECMIDISIEAHIPEDYIENLTQRIDIYKKIATVSNNEDAMDILDELIDRFGDPPDSVKGLVDVALIRGAAAAMGMEEISQREDKVLFFPTEFNMQIASKIASQLSGRAMVSMGNKPYIAVRIKKGEKPLETIREVLEITKDK